MYFGVYTDRTVWQEIMGRSKYRVLRRISHTARDDFIENIEGISNAFTHLLSL